MDALRAWRASSYLIGLASRAAAVSTARAKIRVPLRCCSSSADVSAPAVAAPKPDRRRRSSASTSDRDSIRAIRLKKVEELRSKDYEPYAFNWSRTHLANQLQDNYSHLENGEECKEDAVSVAGRIVARRAFGKLAFLTLRDNSGTIQVKAAFGIAS